MVYTVFCSRVLASGDLLKVRKHFVPGLAHASLLGLIRPGPARLLAQVHIELGQGVKAGVDRILANTTDTNNVPFLSPDPPSFHLLPPPHLILYPPTPYAIYPTYTSIPPLISGAT